MQVILLEKMYRLGDIGGVVDVAAGYARNYLFPRKKVIRATQKNKDFFEQQRAMLEQQNNEVREKAEQVAASMSTNTAIKIARQAGEDGRLYGSVNVRDIIDAVFTATGSKVSSESVILDQRIKSLGVFDVKIMLHPDVVVVFSMSVVRSEH